MTLVATAAKRPWIRVWTLAILEKAQYALRV
jgi:hypothetical protein